MNLEVREVPEELQEKLGGKYIFAILDDDDEPVIVLVQEDFRAFVDACQEGLDAIDAELSD